MQCFVLDGLGDGLASGDEDGPELEDDPVGVLVMAVDVASVGAGFAVRAAGCR